MTPHRLAIFFLMLTTSVVAQNQTSGEGSITGVVIDKTTSRPVEYAAVVIKNKADGKTARSAATDAKGAFGLEKIPFGAYELNYSLVGAENPETVPVTVDAQHRAINLGKLALGGGDGTVKLDKLEVTARKEAFYNSIDRKVYNVGKDIQSVAGSASSLLQNIPSVQVDIEGNVSLRGDDNVLILINGKTSTMMGKNRAAVLEQMPADGIDKIEVITNPSAKYKPDGTAGIINIVLKKKQDPGYSGSVRSTVGNDRRYSVGLNGNYRFGKFNFNGTANLRQDDRPRSVHDERTHADSTGVPVSTTQVTAEEQRPLSRIVKFGADYKVDDKTTVGGAVSYNYRDFLRHSTLSTLTRTGSAVTQDYDRVRTDPEYEKDLEFTGTLTHAFAKEDRELTLELKHGTTTEQEDNRYANIYRVGTTDHPFDNTLNKSIETNTEASADYSHPINEDSKLEMGYDGQWNKVDMDFRGAFFSTIAGTWQPDIANTNRFIYRSDIHALYSTYARKIDNFGFLAGVRLEQADIHTDQVTARLTGKNDYSHLYPSLHLTYNLTELSQVQLNYSHRVHRPEGDDLNPFPKYDDPFNLRAGNPHLRAEEIHSVEAGYQYKNNDTTYLATVYYRYRYNGMTEVRRFVDSVTLQPDLNGTVLFTTKENLGVSRAGGLELIATTRIKEKVGINLSTNIYRSEIDASNLGFSDHRSTIAWDAKLNASWDVSKTTLVQLNSNYTAKRLTPQGYRYPTFITNIGLRHNFKDKKTALILSVSDVFNSLKERTHIDTPTLHEDIVRRRSSRIFFAGVVYTFGKPTKKSKDDLGFDSSL